MLKPPKVVPIREPKPEPVAVRRFTRRIVRNIQGKRVTVEISVRLTPLPPSPVSAAPPVEGNNVEHCLPIRLKESALFRPIVKRDPQNQKMWILLDSFFDRSDELHRCQQAGAGRDGQQPVTRTERKEQDMEFSIDTQDRITVVAEGQEVPEGGERFQTERQLATLAATWPARRLIAIWNHLPGVTPVNKFTDRKTAVQRIWKAVQNPGPAATGPGAVPGRNKGTSAKPPSPKQQPKATRANTKAAAVIALLEQPSGASLEAIMNATGWQPHSVRGFISGQLGKRLGFRVRSFERDGERVYAIRR